MSLVKSNLLQVPASGYRIHRFPPLAQPMASDDEFAIDDSWQESQIDLQQKLEEGFQTGLEQGHEEGLRQGLSQGNSKAYWKARKKVSRKASYRVNSPVSRHFLKRLSQ